MKPNGSRWWWPSLLRITCCALLAACGAADIDDEDTSTETAALGPWGPDPCKTLKPTIFDTNHDHRFIGTDGPDVIFGTEGDDEIWGNGGNDVICARGGEDVVHGGAGDDYIDGGSDNDLLDGGAGDDIIHGRGGGDRIFGGPGNDKLFGDILDDELYGEEGNDLLVGGHGVDKLHGGPGDDWLRGDTNGDDFIGGEGYDVVSFATATPPGQPQGTKANPNPINGVTVDFAEESASGDGNAELLKGVEKVIGSPFTDSFTGIGGKKVVPGYGGDVCDGQPCGLGPVPQGNVFVYVTPEARDRGVVVLGTPGDDDLHIAAVGHTIVVTAQSGAAIAPGAGCSHEDAQHPEVVSCPIQDEALRYVLGWGDSGNDTIVMSGDFPRDITVHLDGGEGDDHLVGGAEEDVLFTGRTGTDWLEGNGGDDALISESYAWDKDLPAEQYPGGADTLDAGSGDDQLVVDYPCGGHSYVGGPGKDVAGFARSGSRPLKAALGGPLDPAHRAPFYGRAFNDLCFGQASWSQYATHLAGDLEILEGSDGDDELHGNDLDNVIWGREGNDHIYGHGGDDILEGLLGNDTIYGGPGHDVLRGGGGYDWLYAGDGEHDRELSCGDGGGKLMKSDANDPAASNCGG